MERIFRDERGYFGSTGSGNWMRHFGLAGAKLAHDVSSLTMDAGAARGSGAQRRAKISVTTMWLPQRGQRQGADTGSGGVVGLAVCVGSASGSRGTMASNSRALAIKRTRLPFASRP